MAGRKGFTLIELLVVIAILALLVSILVPALQKAREIAMTAKCAAQMKTQGSALTLYAEDNVGWIPPGCGKYPNPAASDGYYWPAWYRYLIRNSSRFPNLWNPKLGYVSTIDAFKCPKTPKFDQNGNDNCRYGMNTPMLTEESQRRPYSQFSQYYAPSRPEAPVTTTGRWAGQELDCSYHYNLHRTIKPQEMYLVGEITSWYPWTYWRITNYGYTEFRHLQTGNVLFHDGHVKNFSPVTLIGMYDTRTWLSLPWINRAD